MFSYETWVVGNYFSVPNYRMTFLVSEIFLHCRVSYRWRKWIPCAITIFPSLLYYMFSEEWSYYWVHTIMSTFQWRTMISKALHLQGGNFGKQYWIHDEGVVMPVRSSECSQQKVHFRKEEKGWGVRGGKKERGSHNSQSRRCSFPLYKSQRLLWGLACICCQYFLLGFRSTHPTPSPNLPGSSQLRDIRVFYLWRDNFQIFLFIFWSSNFQFMIPILAVLPPLIIV